MYSGQWVSSFENVPITMNSKAEQQYSKGNTVSSRQGSSVVLKEKKQKIEERIQTDTFVNIWQRLLTESFWHIGLDCVLDTHTVKHAR